MVEDLFKKYGVGRQEKKPIKLGSDLSQPRMTQEEINTSLRSIGLRGFEPERIQEQEESPYLGALEKGFERLGQFSTVAGERLGVRSEEAAVESVQEFGRSAQEPVDPSQAFFYERTGQEFEDIFEAEGILPTLKETGQFIGQLVAHPKETAKLILESTALSTPALAGGAGGAVAGAAVGSAVPVVGTALGAVVGGLLGTTSGSAFVEYGATVTEELAKAAPSMEKEDLLQALRTPEVIDSIEKKGARKATGVAAVDGALFLLGGTLASIPGRTLQKSVVNIGKELGETSTDLRVLLSNPAIRARASGAIRDYKQSMRASVQVPQIAAQFGLETVGEGAGEALGQQLAHGEVDLKEVGLEVAGGIGPAAVQTAIEFGQLGSGKYAKILKDPNIQEQIRNQKLKTEGDVNPISQTEFKNKDVKKAWSSIMDLYSQGVSGQSIGHPEEEVVGPVPRVRDQIEQISQNLIEEKYLTKTDVDPIAANEIEDIVQHLEGKAGVNRLRLVRGRIRALETRAKRDETLSDAEVADKKGQLIEEYFSNREIPDTPSLEGITVEEIPYEGVTVEGDALVTESRPTTEGFQVDIEEEVTPEEINIEGIPTSEEIDVQEIILTKSNKPYKTYSIASAQLKKQGLTESHDIISFDNGFALAPKGRDFTQPELYFNEFDDIDEMLQYYSGQPDTISNRREIRKLNERRERVLQDINALEAAPEEIGVQTEEPVSPEREVILTAKGTPYRSEKIAATQLTRKGLSETHEVIKHGGGYAITAKTEEESPSLLQEQADLIPTTEEDITRSDINYSKIEQSDPQVQSIRRVRQKQVNDGSITQEEADNHVKNYIDYRYRRSSKELPSLLQEQVDIFEDPSDVKFSLTYKYPEITEEQSIKNKNAFDHFVSRIQDDAVQVKWAATVDDLPIGLQDRITEMLSDDENPEAPGGFFSPDTNEVWIIGDAHKSEKAILRTLFHEVVGHYGLRGLFGNGYIKFLENSLKNTTNLLQEAFDYIGAYPHIKDNLSPRRGNPTIRLKFDGKIQNLDKQNALSILDEYIAHRAETLVENPPSDNFFRRLVTWVKHKLRSFGFGTKYPESSLTIEDIHNLLQESHSRLLKDSEYRSVQHATIEDIMTATEAAFPPPVSEDITPKMLFSLRNQEAIQEKRGISHTITTNVSNLMTKDFGKVRQNAYQRRISKIKEHMRKSPYFSWWHSQGNLPHVSSYNLVARKTVGAINRGDKLARKFYIKHRNLNSGEQKLVFDYFTTKEASTDNLPKSVKDIAIEAKKAIEDLGTKLYQMGKIPEESYEAMKGSYLPTRYYKYITSYIGTGKKKSFENYLKGQKDLPDGVRATLGIIRDPSILVPETIGTINRDIALEEFFQSVLNADKENQYTWFLGTHAVAMYEGKKRTLQSLEIDLDRVQEQLSDGIGGRTHQYSPQEYKVVQDEAIKLKAAISEATQQMREQAIEYLKKTGNEINEENVNTFIDGNYKKIPRSTQYGAIRGLWVRREIYDDIVNTFDSFSADRDDWLSKLVAPGGKAEKGHQLWKAMKVILNPPSWFRNGIGNFTLLDISTNTPVHKLADMLYEELSNFGESKYIKMAIDNGLFGATFSSSELYLISEQNKSRIERAIAQKQASVAGRKSKELFWIADEKFYNVLEIASNIYGNIEGIFKAVRMRDHIETWEKESRRSFDNLSADERIVLEARAAEEANKAIFEYSNVPKWVNIARRFPFGGSPFITFQYKAVGATLEALARRPQKFIKYMLLPYLLAHLTMAMNDIDEDEYDDIVKKMPGWMKEKSSMYILPWKDSNNNWQAMSFGYYFPWGQYMDAVAFQGKNFDWEEPLWSTGELGLKTVTDTFGFLGGPIPDMITAIGSGKDTFTGRDIFPEGATGKEKFYNTMSYLHGMWLPSFISPHGYLGHTLSQFGVGMYGPAQQFTEFGTPKETFPQSQARAVGLNVYGFDPSESNIRNLRSFSSEIRKTKSHRRRILTDHNISREEKVKKLKELNQKIRSIIDRQNKYISGEE